MPNQRLFSSIRLLFKQRSFHQSSFYLSNVLIIHSFRIFIWRPVKKSTQRCSQSSYGQRQMSSDAWRRKKHCSRAASAT